MPVVAIRSFQTAIEIQIPVIDKGKGIRAIHVQKTFDMLYRITSKSPGARLGLYIAREAIVKLVEN